VEEGWQVARPLELPLLQLILERTLGMLKYAEGAEQTAEEKIEKG